MKIVNLVKGFILLAITFVLAGFIVMGAILFMTGCAIIEIVVRIASWMVRNFESCQHDIGRAKDELREAMKKFIKF